MKILQKKASVILSIIVVVCILSAQSFMVVFSASSTPCISVSSAGGKAGDTVDVTITMSNNPGFVSANLYVNYDEDVLTLKKVKDGGLLSGVTHSDNYTSPYGLCWVNDLAKENFKVNGVLATLTFEISKNAKQSKTTISLEQDILDCEIENVVFKLTDGNVEVGNSSAKSENSNSISGDSQNSENSEKTYNQSSDTAGSLNNSNNDSDSVTKSSTENANADDKETDNIKNDNSASVLSTATADSAQKEGSTSSAVWLIAVAILLIVVLISVGGYVFYKHKRKN